MSHSPKLRHRPSRTIPASIVSSLLLIVGGLLIAAAVFRLVNGSWPAATVPVSDLLSGTNWAAPGWVGVCVLVWILGLILVVAAVKPGEMNAAVIRPRRVDPSDVPSELIISRKAITRLAAARAEQLDGVESVRVNATAKRVRLRVWTHSRARDQMKEQIGKQVHAEMASAGLHPAPRVTTRVDIRTH